MFPAGIIDAANGLLNIRPGRKPATLAEILSKAASLAERLGGDPEMAAAGDRVFVFGYDQQQNAAVASYNLPAEEIGESILDAPKPEMDPAVWEEGKTGPVLTGKAEAVIAGVSDWARRFGVPAEAGVHVIGSIASNSYSEESDVDVHFYGDCIEKAEPDVDGFNKRFKAAFREFAAEHPEYAEIGGHPVEVYAQPNEFQDMMSVGCYDVGSKEWKAGPDVKDTSFDPYSEYYEDDMEYAGDLVEDIRTAVMGVYEKAVVMRKSTDPAFKERIGSELLADAKKLARLFEKIKGMRKAVSQPVSADDALRKRRDRRWHVADSAFKLLDKFGYTAVCKECQKAAESGSAEDAAETILNAVA